MEFWRDNFVGNMYGPTFLAFYAVVIVVVIAVGRWKVWSADRTLEEHVDDPPEPIDPVDIALLRGDINEVLRLTVVDLVQRGYLRISEGRFLSMRTGEKIVQALTPPDIRHLTSLQRSVFSFFRAPKNAGEIFLDRDLKEWHRARCIESESRLSDFRLLTPEEIKQRGKQIALFAALIIGALGGYKLLVALSKGKTNVAFLIIMGIAGIVAAGFICQAPRVSRRGRNYIERLQTRYGRLKNSITGLTSAVDDSALVYAVAIYGISALEDTPYQNLVSTFRKATMSSASGCSGSGCGGSGCGGGVCGGGCVGCGGG